MVRSEEDTKVLPIMEAIRERIRRVNQHEAQELSRARQSLPPEIRRAIPLLQARMATVLAGIPHIGRMPPVPPTLRGRGGAVAVLLVRRAMFWLLPPMRATQEQVARVLEEQIRFNEALIQALELAHLRIDRLTAQTAETGERTQIG